MRREDASRDVSGERLHMSVWAASPDVFQNGASGGVSGALL